MIRDFLDLLPWWAWAAVVALFALIVFAAVAEANAWSEFAATHKCRVVGQTSGSYSTGYGVGFNGQGAMVTTYTPGKTAYACDDGVTYWR